MPEIPPPRISEALAHHEAGRLDIAEGIDREILKKQPDHADALHLLGTIHGQRGEFDEATRMIGRALKQNPHHPSYHCNLATALLEKGEEDKAIQHYQKALTAAPDYLDAHFNLGNVLRAHKTYDRAEAHYRRVLEIDPAHVPARNNLALCLVETVRLDDAIGELHTALQIAPEFAETHANLALVLQMAGRFEDALARYVEALRFAPNDAEVRSNHGVALALAGRPADAEQEYLEALRLDPGLSDAYLNIGNLRRDERRFDEAETAYCRAIELAPADDAGWNNLGGLMSAMGRYDEAEPALQTAIRLAPDNVGALSNLALMKKKAAQFEQALAIYDRAVTLDPNNPELRTERAFVELLIGNFTSGWQDYLSRPTMVAVADFHREPLAHDLSGKRVLVCRDQGLGDEIFFARFIPQLAARGAEISYRSDPRLAAMFERGGVAPVIYGSDPEDNFDLKISVGDLPYLLGMDSSDEVPRTIRLQALPEKLDRLRRCLDAFGPPPYIGVAWRAGTPDRERLLYKETPMARLADVLAPLDVRVINLQRIPADDETSAFSQAIGRPVCDLTATNDDLEDMLALVGLLDDFICVSNTNVHLAASCGRSCRLLIPNPPEFRWMAKGVESPWFPGMTIYRQGSDSDWSAAFDALERDLKAAFPTA